MRYQVPQFIDVEDTIFGPLTFKQFLYVGGGIGLAYVSFTYLPTYLALPLAAAAFGLGMSLAFVKINKKPFIHIMEAFIKYIFHPKLYIWQKISKKEKKPKKKEEEAPKETQEGLNKSKLKDLAWSLDIHEQTKNPNE